MSTHAALVVQSPGHVRVESVATNSPRAGEILVATVCAGICGSDLDMMRGSRPIGTRVLGHEGVARIVAVGPGVTRFAVGQYVTFLPNNPTDLEDVLGVSTEGLFQQYLLVRQAAIERGMVIPFDPEIPLVCGPLLEPFATVIYGQRIMQQVRRPATMVIVGAGPIGVLNALYARAEGCSQVYLVDTSQPRLDWAAKHGIVEGSHALLNSPSLVEALLERTERQGVDAVYICTPRSATRSALQQALRFVREDGCISLTAGTDTQDAFPELPGVDLDEIRRANVCGLAHEMVQCVSRQGKRLWLTGHSGASASYIQEAMKLVRERPANYARVISHTVSYRAAPRMFEHLLTEASHSIASEPCVKVIVDFTTEVQEISVFDPRQLSQKGDLDIEAK